MPEYSFRIRFIRSPRDTVNIDTNRWERQLGENKPLLLLCANKQDETIKDSKQWVLKSEGWDSPESASSAAATYIDALILTLVKLRVGADYGFRGPKSAYTKAGLEMLEAQTGFRMLNNVHGLMIYETDPQPHFANFGASILRGVTQNHFEQVFEYAIKNPKTISARERLSFELFNSSFFQNSEDSRFLVLVMAVEALLEPSPRSPSAAAHVETLITATQETQSLSSEEKSSILGSLKWLRNESINQAGRKLSIERLGERKYLDKEAPTFFSYCYSLRSSLVHGEHPLPSQDEIANTVAQLEVFVSDLLSGDLRDIELS